MSLEAQGFPSRGAVDLSKDAIKARQTSERRGNGPQGLTGRQMGQRARSVLEAAQRARRTGNKRPAGARRNAALKKSAEALVTAATQIRIAAATPLDKGFLHHLSINEIQDIEREVHRLAAGGTDEAMALLAVDTHRRVEQEKVRASRNEQEPTR
jgi:hypothetical protein